MNLLFMHPNFPGQFRQLAPAFAAKPGYRVVGMGHRSSDWRETNGIPTYYYDAFPLAEPVTMSAIDGFAQQVRRGRAAMQALRNMADDGFSPDVVVAHPGWGDTMFLHDVFPDARLVALMEYYYRSKGSDVDFDPEFPTSGVDLEFIRLRNLPSTMAFEAAAVAVSPTRWQADLFPDSLRKGILIQHEGVDSQEVSPDPMAKLSLPDGRVLSRADEVLTYVSRGLEPMRGFHSFMRALPEIQRRRPNCFTVIVGADEPHYGRGPQGRKGWREVLMAEVGDRLDLDRIWFAGRLTYSRYLQVLRVSTVHTYLTYPFVLSWSLIEAMAAGCAIVASDTGPVTEVIKDGETGILCNFLDCGSIASSVASLASDAALRLQLGGRARSDAVARFDFQRVALPGYERIFSDVAPSGAISYLEAIC